MGGPVSAQGLSLQLERRLRQFKRQRAADRLQEEQARLMRTVHALQRELNLAVQREQQSEVTVYRPLSAQTSIQLTSTLGFCVGDSAANHMVYLALQAAFANPTWPRSASVDASRARGLSSPCISIRLM